MGMLSEQVRKTRTKRNKRKKMKKMRLTHILYVYICVYLYQHIRIYSASGLQFLLDMFTKM